MRSMDDDPPVDSDQEKSPFRQGLVVWLATGSWIGLVPFAPGTFGSLWGIPLALALWQIPAIGPMDAVWVQLVVLIALVASGVPLCTLAAKRLGGKDPGSIVYDEFVCLPIVYFLLPVDSMEPIYKIIVIASGFILFRIFDISKLPPARQFERFPGGLGIMADDVAAAIYANLTMQLLYYLVLYYLGAFH